MKPPKANKKKLVNLNAIKVKPKIGDPLAILSKSIDPPPTPSLGFSSVCIYAFDSCLRFTRDTDNGFL
jgi:hypothetical protein